MIKEFMIFCSGADSDLLKECPKYESNKYASIGAAVFFTGLFAFISGAYALYRVFYRGGGYGPVIAAILIGLVWAFMIFNLDRYIVSSMRKTDSKRKELLTALPRILIAIMISFVIAKPLEVRIFQDRIAAQISDNELTKRESDKVRITDISDIDNAGKNKKENDDIITNIKKELAGDPNTPEFKQAMNELNEASSEKDKVYRQTWKKLDAARTNINFVKKDEKFKTFYYKDGIEIEENKVVDLSADAKKLLAGYEAEVREVNSKRSTVKKKLNRKSKRVKDLRAQHQKTKEEELATANVRDTVLSNYLSNAELVRKDLTTRTNTATDIAFTNTFITQVEALGDLTAWKSDIVDENGVVLEEAESNSMFWMNIAIIILFILIETAPVVVKLLSKKGIYEDKVIELEQVSENNTETKVKLNIANNKDILQIDSNSNKILMDRITSAQIEIAERIIQKWKFNEFDKLKTTDENSINKVNTPKI